MNSNWVARHPLRTALLAALALTGLGTGTANAGCADIGAAGRPAGNFAAPSAAPSGFIRTSLTDEYTGQPAIVGLWAFTMTAGGQPFDFGTIQWHEDGTEMTISGGRNPTTGDVCMGAWHQVGRSTYRLSHYAMPYQGGVYAGFAHFTETVTVDATGNGYSGTFTLQVYADTAADPFDESTPPVATVSGTVSARRLN